MSSQVAVVTIPSDESLHSRSIVEPSSFLNIEQYQRDQLGRDRLEIFVRQVFRQAYAAHISTFYPHLIGITRPDNAFAAVAGIRSASHRATGRQQQSTWPGMTRWRTTSSAFALAQTRFSRTTVV